MKRVALFVLIFVFSISSFAQNNQSQLDGRLYGVVYDVPATKDVTVREDVPYAGSLKIDIYSPPGAKAGEKFPAVIFLNAIGDAPGQPKVKSWGIYRSFPRLVAARGFRNRCARSLIFSKKTARNTASTARASAFTRRRRTSRNRPFI